MFMSAQIIYYSANTGLAALIIFTWVCWLLQHIFLFYSSLETLSSQLLDKLTRVWLITCGSCLEISRVWCKATVHNFPWTLQCPHQHLELIVTPNHQAFFLWFSWHRGPAGRVCSDLFPVAGFLWMKWEGMASDPKHCSKTMNGFKLYGRRLIAFKQFDSLTVSIYLHHCVLESRLL